MNTQSYTITDAQKQTLDSYLANGDRVGFYVALIPWKKRTTRRA